MEALKVGGAQTKAKQVLARRVARYLRLATCNAEGLRIAPDDAREIVAEAMERSESEEGRAKALSLSKEYHRDELIYEEEMRGKDFVRSADALDELPAAETFTHHMRTIKPITLIRLLVVAIRSAGLAVAFPVGIGTALVLGTSLTYGTDLPDPNTGWTSVLPYSSALRSISVRSMGWSSENATAPARAKSCISDRAVPAPC